MALTQKNQLLISYKKLVGKVHTNAKFGTDNESISTNVQTGFSTIFSDAIPTIPNSSVYSITNGTVEKITFSLVGIDLSNYANTVGNLSNNTTIDREGEVATAGIHAYKLVLPADYQTFSSNPKKGSAPFTNSYTASNSNGALQLVAPTYGPAYSAEINSLSGIILESQDEDYVLDYYSGILFLQDIARVPTSVTAYVYIGNYAKDRISIPFLTGTLGISGSHGTFASLTASDGSITNLTSSNIRILNDLFVAGTASVAMLNTVNQQSLQIGDKHIIIMSGATDHATLSGSGILWGSGSTGPTYGPNGEHAYVRYDSVTDKLEIFPGLETNTLTASFISSSNYIGLNVGSVGGVTTAVWSLMTGSTNITVTNGTSSLKNSVTGLTSVSSTGFTGSLNGNASSATTAITAQTASYVATGSAIATFTNDVRKQISGSGVISYNNSTGIISYTGGAGGGTVNTGSAGYIAYYPSLGTTVDDTSQIYTDGTNVGIGTTTLNAKLDVGGTVKLSRNNTLDEGGEIQFGRAVDNAVKWIIDTRGTGDLSDLRIFDNSSSMAIYVQSQTRNVGIGGTSSPSSKLYVDGTITIGTNNQVYQAGVLGYNDTNWGFLYRPPRTGSLGAHNFEAADGTDLLTITNAGKVGIGTTPDAGLHLAGTDANTLPRVRLQNTTPSTGKTWETTSGDDGKLYIGIPTVVDAIVADSNGNVGIGKSIPVKPLDVAKAGGIRISRTESSSSNNEIYFQDNGQISSFDQYHRIIFDRANDKLELREYGDIVFSAGSIGATRTETVTIKNNGNVGINVSNPTSHKLQVNGTISGSTLYGNGSGLVSIPNLSLQNSSVTIGSTAISLGGSSTTVAGLTSVTATTFNGSLNGNASTVTNGVYTTNIGSHATTGVTAGNGLSGGGTVGALTLNVGAGTGITVAADTVSVDTTVVVPTSRTITGAANRITVNGLTTAVSLANNISLTLPQDIATNSNVQFNSIRLSNNPASSTGRENYLDAKNTPKLWAKIRFFNDLSTSTIMEGYNILTVNIDDATSGLISIEPAYRMIFNNQSVNASISWASIANYNSAGAISSAFRNLQVLNFGVDSTNNLLNLRIVPVSGTPFNFSLLTAEVYFYLNIQVFEVI